MKAGNSKAGIGSSAPNVAPTPPDHLTLAAVPDTAADPLVELLTSAGLHTDSGELQSGPTLYIGEIGQQPVELAREMASQTNAHLLLAYRDPVPVTAAAIAQGVDPTEAVAHWLEEARNILAAFRRARRRILLFESGAALANPEDFISQLNQRLGLSLQTPVEPTGQPAPAVQDPVYVLMAESALRQDAAARRASAELQAGAVPLGALQAGTKLDISATFHSYRKKSEEAIRQVNGLTEQNELLLAQLQQVQKELESTFLNAQARDKEKSALSDQLKQAASENQQLKNQLARGADQGKVEDLEEENDLLRQQLCHVQEELEHYYLDTQQLQLGESEVEKMRKRIKHLEHRIRYFEGSKSWKLTAPLRGFRKLFKRQ